MVDKKLIAALEKAQEWIREPDWEEDFNSVDLAKWINDRPITVIALAAARLRELTAEPGAEPVALPELPDNDDDFTPDLARKIIARYQEIIRSLATPEAKTGFRVIIEPMGEYVVEMFDEWDPGRGWTFSVGPFGCIEAERVLKEKRENAVDGITYRVRRVSDET